MDICRSLTLPSFNQYYLLQDDLNSCPEILQKFKNFLDNFSKKQFLGYINRKDEEFLIEPNARIIAISNYLEHKYNKRVEQRPSLVVRCPLVRQWHLFNSEL